MKRRALLASALGSVLPTVPNASAQQLTPHQRVQDALVMVNITGTRQSDRVQDTGSGTGFFVNGEGLIFTSNHIRANKRFIPGTEEYSIRRVLPGGLLTNDQRVEYYDHDEKHDILALWMPVYGHDVPFLPVEPLPARVVRRNVTQLFVSGYPPEAYQSDSGEASSFNGPPPNFWLWTVNFDTIPGLSGAPVYLENGAVVGLMKGANDANPGIAYIVPSNIWATTLANLNVTDPRQTQHVVVFAEGASGERDLYFEGRVSAEQGALLARNLLKENVMVEVHSVEGVMQSSLLRLGDVGGLTIAGAGSGEISILASQ